MKEYVTNNLISHLNNLIRAVDLCISNQLILPALMLLYSGIDVVGALERKPGTGTKASFTQWVDSYMLKTKALGCSSVELYGARCGLLHTLASESDLSRSGKARQINYAWGGAKSDDLKVAGKILNHPDILTIHFDELFDAFKTGLIAYLREIDEDEKRRNILLKNAGIWMTELPLSLVTDILKLHDTEQV